VTSRDRKAERTRAAQAAAKRRLAARIAMGVGAGVLALAALYWWTAYGSQAAPRDSMAGQFPFQVGKPRPGAPAPPIRLPATRDGTFDLASLRGQRVLLYFQEGIMCQPCWDQLKDIESNIGELRAAGVDSVVSITTDPIDALKEKARNERLSTPVLSDPDLSVSRAYDANSYGMMGRGRDGHTFILLDKDGTILWRADYGGAPKYTMYVPVRNLIADMRQGLEKDTANR
jgi:peroxiredoxin Q/BCP